MKILVLNSGSSSQKASLYEIGETLPVQPPPCLWEGRIEWGSDTAKISVKNSKGAVQREQLRDSSREQVVRHLLSTLNAGPAAAIAPLSEIDAVGHRVVHGGPNFEDPVVVTPEVRSAIWRHLHARTTSYSCRARRHGHCREYSQYGHADRCL